MNGERRVVKAEKVVKERGRDGEGERQEAKIRAVSKFIQHVIVNCLGGEIMRGEEGHTVLGKACVDQLESYGLQLAMSTIGVSFRIFNKLWEHFSLRIRPNSLLHCRTLLEGYF